MFDAADCLAHLVNHHYDALILHLDLDYGQERKIKEILDEASRREISAFCISEQLNSDVMDLLFCYRITHYFLEPVSYRDIFTKLDSLKGSRESSSLSKKAAGLLHTLGIPNSVQGYNYILDAIVNCYYHEDYLKGVTKHLYPMLASEYKTTASAVEKSIRHAIEVAFSRSEQSYLYDFFKGTIRSDKAKATNSQFISMCVEYIKTEGL